MLCAVHDSYWKRIEGMKKKIERKVYRACVHVCLRKIKWRENKWKIERNSFIEIHTQSMDFYHLKNARNGIRNSMARNSHKNILYSKLSTAASIKTSFSFS